MEVGQHTTGHYKARQHSLGYYGCPALSGLQRQSFQAEGATLTKMELTWQTRGVISAERVDTRGGLGGVKLLLAEGASCSKLIRLFPHIQRAYGNT